MRHDCDLSGALDEDLPPGTGQTSDAADESADRINLYACARCHSMPPPGSKQRYCGGNSKP